MNTPQEEDILIPDNLLPQKTAMLEGEAMPVHYIRAPGTYHSDLRVKPLYHMSVADCTIHFGKEGYGAMRCFGTWTTMRKRMYQMAIHASQMLIKAFLVCYRI